MSFSDKLAGLMARPGQSEPPKDDVPWYMRYGAQGLGIVGAFFAVLFGFWNCFGVITINFASVVSGILQILVGVLVMAIEAPICCMFVDLIQDLAKMADARPYWYRAALYCGIAVPPIVIFPSLASVFGCGLIFGTGVLYGMMSVGKKAPIEQMRSAAASADNRFSGRHSNNLVNNAQPISITGPPPFDSNV